MPIDKKDILANTSAESHDSLLSDEQKRAGEWLIPITAEQLYVSKQQVETGRIRLTKLVSEETVPVSVELRQEDTHIERVPINRPVDEIPAVRQEGDTMVIPVLKEEYVIVKRLVLVEEVRVRKTQTTTTEEQTVTLRQEQVHVDRSSDSIPMQVE